MRAWEFREDLLTILRQHVQALPDHRREYLDYEGPISGDRGYVRRVAEGTCELLRETPTEWVVRLQSEVIAGELRIVRNTPEDQSWEADLSLQSS
jgi:CRP-like cAMP-binding protein